MERGADRDEPLDRRGADLTAEKPDGLEKRSEGQDSHGIRKCPALDCLLRHHSDLPDEEEGQAAGQHELRQPELVRRPGTGELRVHEAGRRDAGERDAGDQAAVDPLHEPRRASSHDQHGHREPEEHPSGLQRPIALDGTEVTWNQDEDGEQGEPKREDTAAENQRVPLPQKREVYQRIWLPKAPQRRRYQQECSAAQHGDDRSGSKPVEPLPLLQRPLDETQSHAGEEKAAPAHRRFGTLPRRRRWDRQVDAQHHQRCEQRAGPEDPMPRPVIRVPSLERRRDAQRAEQLHRIGADPVDRVARGERAQRIAERQRIKRP